MNGAIGRRNTPGYLIFSCRPVGVQALACSVRISDFFGGHSQGPMGSRLFKGAQLVGQAKAWTPTEEDSALSLTRVARLQSPVSATRGRTPSIDQPSAEPIPTRRRFPESSC